MESIRDKILLDQIQQMLDFRSGQWMLTRSFHSCELRCMDRVDGIQQKITIKTMSIFNDTNNSINEILEMLKNYRTEGRPNSSSFHQPLTNHTDDSFANTSHRPIEDHSILPASQPPSQQQPPSRYSTHKIQSTNGLRLHSSLQHIPKRRSTSRDCENIFSRLYEEDKALRERREQLFASGRRQQQDQERKECTFSPHLKQKSGKNMTQEEAEGFYQKNIDWQRKVHKETKIKQCEKINQGVANLTFTPKINTRREKPNKENVGLLEKKGVEEFLQRQQKAKHCIETLQSRKKNPYSQIWNFKKSQFSYLH